MTIPPVHSRFRHGLGGLDTTLMSALLELWVLLAFSFRGIRVTAIHELTALFYKNFNMPVI